MKKGNYRYPTRQKYSQKLKGKLIVIIVFFSLFLSLMFYGFLKNPHVNAVIMIISGIIALFIVIIVTMRNEKGNFEY